MFVLNLIYLDPTLKHHARLCASSANNPRRSLYPLPFRLPLAGTRHSRYEINSLHLIFLFCANLCDLALKSRVRKAGSRSVLTESELPQHQFNCGCRRHIQDSGVNITSLFCVPKLLLSMHMLMRFASCTVQHVSCKQCDA